MSGKLFLSLVGRIAIRQKSAFVLTNLSPSRRRRRSAKLSQMSPPQSEPSVQFLGLCVSLPSRPIVPHPSSGDPLSSPLGWRRRPSFSPIFRPDGNRLWLLLFRNLREIDKKSPSCVVRTRHLSAGREAVTRRIRLFDISLSPFLPLLTSVASSPLSLLARLNSSRVRTRNHEQHSQPGFSERAQNTLHLHPEENSRHLRLYVIHLETPPVHVWLSEF